jgi:hypothetical protein
VTAKTTAWTAALAAAASLPYLLLKAYWSLGGSAGITSGQPLEFGFLAGWGTVLIDLLGTVGCAGLAVLAMGKGAFPRGIVILGGRRVPHALVLLPGWAGAILLIVTGLAGTILYLRDLLGGVAGTEFAPWVGPLVYGGWLVWGLVLGLALSRYQRLTRLLPAPTE